MEWPSCSHPAFHHRWSKALNIVHKLTANEKSGMQMLASTCKCIPQVSRKSHANDSQMSTSTAKGVKSHRCPQVLQRVLSLATVSQVSQVSRRCILTISQVISSVSQFHWSLCWNNGVAHNYSLRTRMPTVAWMPWSPNTHLQCFIYFKSL